MNTSTAVEQSLPQSPVSYPRTFDMKVRDTDEQYRMSIQNRDAVWYLEVAHIDYHKRTHRQKAYIIYDNEASVVLHKVKMLNLKAFVSCVMMDAYDGAAVEGL
jgi:hypothetical protein